MTSDLGATGPEQDAAASMHTDARMGRMCRRFCRYCPHTWDTATLIAPPCISPSRINYWMKPENASNHMWRYETDRQATNRILASKVSDRIPARSEKHVTKYDCRLHVIGMLCVNYLNTLWITGVILICCM